MRTLAFISVLICAFGCVISSSVTIELEGREFAKYGKWLEDNGAYFPKGKVADYGYTRGTFMTRDVDAEELVIQAPAKLVFDCKKDSAILRWIPHGMSDLWAYAVRLVMEKGNPDSFHQPWIQTLPTDMSFMPWYWSDEEIQYIQDEGYISAVHAMREDLEKVYNAVFKVRARGLPGVPVNDSIGEAPLHPGSGHHVHDDAAEGPHFHPSGNYSIEELKWAASQAFSRSWGVGMIPLLDMANHHPTKGASLHTEHEIPDDYGSPLKIVGLRSVMKLEAGDQFYVNYGHLQAFQLLVYYGFAPAIDEDFAEITLSYSFGDAPVPESDEEVIRDLFEEREMGRAEQGTRVGTFLLSWEGDLPSDMLDFARLVVYKPSCDPNPPPHTGEISLENEVRAIKLIHSTVQSIQADATRITSAADDGKLLEEGNLSPNARTAVRARMQGKLIRERALQHLDHRFRGLLDGSVPIGQPHSEEEEQGEEAEHLYGDVSLEDVS